MLVFVLAAASMFAISHSALAGITLATGTNFVNTPDVNNDGMANANEPFGHMAVIGGAPAPSSGNFTTYVPDTVADPQINDLERYRYLLDGLVDPSFAGGPTVPYIGNYVVFYDLNLNGLSDEGLIVSTGTFTFTADYAAQPSGPGSAVLLGTMTQAGGPNNPALPDLFNGGTATLSYVGTYIPIVSGQLGNNGGNGLSNFGSIQGTLRTSGIPGVIPEPSTCALLGMGLLPLLRPRRRQVSR